MHGGTNDLCVEELSAGESSATRTKVICIRIGPRKSAWLRQLVVCQFTYHALLVGVHLPIAAAYAESADLIDSATAILHRFPPRHL
jgi:hypothetical protein